MRENTHYKVGDKVLIPSAAWFATGGQNLPEADDPTNAVLTISEKYTLEKRDRNGYDFNEDFFAGKVTNDESDYCDEISDAFVLGYAS